MFAQSESEWHIVAFSGSDGKSVPTESRPPAAVEFTDRSDQVGQLTWRSSALAAAVPFVPPSIKT